MVVWRRSWWEQKRDREEVRKGPWELPVEYEAPWSCSLGRSWAVIVVVVAAVAATAAVAAVRSWRSKVQGQTLLDAVAEAEARSHYSEYCSWNLSGFWSFFELARLLRAPQLVDSDIRRWCLEDARAPSYLVPGVCA